MKKILLFTAILFASITMGNAQRAIPPSASDDVTLNVRLYPIQSIIVNADQKTVNLEYNTKDGYSKGVSLEQKDHLTIFSTGAFEVKVKSFHTNIPNTGNNKTIASSGIKIIATDGVNNPLAGVTMIEVQLSESISPLISSTVGGVDKTFNITYSGLGENKYINNYIHSEGSPTTYSTTVTYSITPK